MCLAQHNQHPQADFSTSMSRIARGRFDGTDAIDIDLNLMQVNI
jgi:hypothetical protein